MKAPDFDEPTSALGKQIKFVVKGQKTKNSDFLSLHTNGALNEMGITIKNNSIFVPGDDVKNTQNGFRSVRLLIFFIFFLKIFFFFFLEDQPDFD